MKRRRFLSGAAAVAAGTSYTLINRLNSKVLAQSRQASTVLRPDLWISGQWGPEQSGRIQAGVKPREAARRIWEGYVLQKPNDNDTIEAFCKAIMSEWERGQPAYLWRTVGSIEPHAREVYVLPSRFTIAHPPYFPDLPNGYYRLNPACEADDLRACVPPSAFFRMLPAETVDVYQPPRKLETGARHVQR